MIPNASSSGSSTITEQMLKKSCTVEPANARLNSSPREICARETIVFVTVVPIFAPMIIGTAFSNDSAAVPTNPTTSDVVVEDDWITDVAKIPITSPTIGFDVVCRIDSATPLPISLNASPSIVMDNMNR